MKTVQVLITDTHFGIKNNSQLWLNSQLDYVYKEFIPLLKKIKNQNDVLELSVIHCGDLFDSKSSINPLIYYKVNKLLKDICSVANELIILAGNHDCYSQIEEDYNINSLDMLKPPSNCKIVSNEVYYKNSNVAFIPWFEFHNIDKLKNSTKDCNLIFTHTDLAHLDENIATAIFDKNIISGHIHVPYKKGNKFNIGACWAMNFLDSNSQRGIYIIENWDFNTIKFVENNSSIKFYRLRNDEIFDDTVFDSIKKTDKVEIYIDKILYVEKKYLDRIAKANESFDCKVIVTDQGVSEVCEDEIYNKEEWNILDMIEKTIPKKLMEKFKKILNEL